MWKGKEGLKSISDRCLCSLLTSPFSLEFDSERIGDCSFILIFVVGRAREMYPVHCMPLCSLSLLLLSKRSH